MRPEGSGGGYDRVDDDVDPHAWEAFTPWRPGDPSTAGEAPPSYSSGFAAEGLYLPSAGSHQDGRAATAESDGQNSARPAESAGTSRRRPMRWSEDSRSLQEGDRIKTTRAMGGNIFAAVQSGAKGRIVRAEHTVLGGRRGDIEFENGSTVRNVELDGNDGLERRGWLD